MAASSCEFGGEISEHQYDATDHDDKELQVEDDSHARVGYISHAIQMQDLKPGDHIYCYRGWGPFTVYSHHGIYIGEKDYEVIHFAGDDPHSLSSKHGAGDKKSGAHIQKCTLEEFANGCKIEIVAYSAPWYSVIFKKHVSVKFEPSQSSAEVIKRAKEYLQSPEKWGAYDLIKNNCETFAVHCKTGRKENLASQGKIPFFTVKNRLDFLPQD